MFLIFVKLLKIPEIDGNWSRLHGTTALETFKWNRKRCSWFFYSSSHCLLSFSSTIMDLITPSAIIKHGTNYKSVLVQINLKNDFYCSSKSIISDQKLLETTESEIHCKNLNNLSDSIVLQKSAFNFLLFEMP